MSLETPTARWLALTAALGMPGLLFAQTDGALHGRVTDPDGAALAGAAVTLEGATIVGGTRSTTTAASGRFRLAGLFPGEYAVEIALAGYETTRFEGIHLSITSSTRLDAVLRIGPARQEVLVVDATPFLDVASSRSVTNFTGALVRELPTERNFYDTIQVAPGITQVNSGEAGRGTVALGSSVQSNSWMIDGVEASAAETGSAWLDLNADLIQEVEILAIGAPAEYGNFTGSVFRVVTRRGGASSSGAASYFHQNDALTWAENYASSLNGDPVPAGDPDGFAFERDRYAEVALTFGGPVIRERLWFMAGGQYSRKSSWAPGTDPASASPTRSEGDRFSMKLTGNTGGAPEFFVSGHVENWNQLRGSTPSVAPSAAFGERGMTAAWTAGLTSTVSANTLVSARYGGWYGTDIHDSPTGSFEMPFVNRDAKPGPTYTGGQLYPWDHVTWSNRFRGRVTHYADDFLGAPHDFRFGVQLARESAATAVAAGPNGAYQYQAGGRIYQVVQEPYRYGGASRALAVFVDDTIAAGDWFSLDLGLRLDVNRGEIPGYDLLAVAAAGQTSEFTAINAVSTAGSAPGYPGVVKWTTLSPRVGFTLRADERGRSTFGGFFGIHYDQNVIGNWEAPSPGATPWTLYSVRPDGTRGRLLYRQRVEEPPQPEDLLPPRSYHYTAAYERQIGDGVSVGVRYVHKYTDRMIGWSILGGRYEPIEWADPYSGSPITLLNQIASPTVVKGNSPGDFPGAPGKYEQTYDGLLFTFAARDAGVGSLQGSYTLSKSQGLIPRPWYESQNNPFYASGQGRDPNSYLNAFQRLQADRPHMFRLQGVLLLPRDFVLALNANFESGKPFSRQVRAAGVTRQPAQNFIVEPAGSRAGLRHPTIWLLDVRLGKRFGLGDVRLKLDGWLYNALNSTASIGHASLRLEDPGEDFVPSRWVHPRRLMLVAGVAF